jgi:AraC family transcriptional regulator
LILKATPKTAQMRSVFQPLEAATRHQHRQSYLAFVMKGSYREIGDQGAFDVHAGDILHHGFFEAHSNQIGKNGTEVINVALPAVAQLPSAFRISNFDDCVSRAQAGETIVAEDLEVVQVIRPHEADWEDELAALLRKTPNIKLSQWANQNGLTPETISRGFKRHFGLTAAEYRMIVQAQGAWQKIASTALPLTAIALDYGYCDQAHMTRAIVALTGAPPGYWRKVNFIQDDKGLNF